MGSLMDTMKGSSIFTIVMKIGKLTMVLIGLSVLGWGAAWVQPAWATPIEYVTPAGPTTSGGPADAKASSTHDGRGIKVPIPSTLILLGAGLAGLIGIRRRLRK